MKTIWTWEIPADVSPERADKTILSALKARAGTTTSVEEEGDDEDVSSSEPWDLSRSRLHSLMEEGLVSSGTRLIEPNDRLKPHEHLRIEIPAAVELEAIPEDLPLEILYEDQHLLVVNKPPGMPVHPSAGHARGTLVNALLFHVRGLSGIGGKLRPGIVHRIDKDTSGALVVTKTDECHRRLSEVFAAHRIERRYWAFCYGTLGSKTERKIESTIGRNPADRKKMAMNVSGGRSAVTYACVREEFGSGENPPFASKIEARLETGRTHQVRVHLTGSGNSLLGDPIYGEPSSNQAKWRNLPEDVRSAVERLPGQALHARVLGFAHPITQNELRFEAALPPALQALYDLLLNRYTLGKKPK